MMSRPDSAAGMAWIWMGVGFLMPLDSRCFRMGGGSFMLLNVTSGEGTCWPSTWMWNISRIFWRRGGRAGEDTRGCCQGGAKG
jgi:hypothetical protein